MSPKADCGSLNVGLPRLQYTGSLTAALSEEGSQSSTMILKVVYSSLNESSAKSSYALKRGAASEGRCLKKFSPTFVGPVCSAVLACSQPARSPRGRVVSARATADPRSSLMILEWRRLIGLNLEERTAMLAGNKTTLFACIGVEYCRDQETPSECPQHTLYNF